MVIASSGSTQIICDQCCLPIFGEYIIHKRRRNGHIINQILCKGCDQKRLKRRLEIDELNDPTEYFYT